MMELDAEGGRRTGRAVRAFERFALVGSDRFEEVT
jgi:hypothetical protein